jgi:glycerol-1-phosphatase
VPPLALFSKAIPQDSTLLSSENGVKGAWKEFEKTYPHIDVTQILSSQCSPQSRSRSLPFNITSTASHGVRTIDNLREHCKITDDDELQVRELHASKPFASPVIGS